MILPIFFLTFYVVSVVQRVTAWVAGVPVLKLVAETSPSCARPHLCQTNTFIDQHPVYQKRRADSLEDEEMYAKVRKGDPYVRNAWQEQELSQLKEGGIVIFGSAFSLGKQLKAVNWRR